MDVRTHMIVFLGDQSFGPWTSTRMIPGRPRDVRPDNFLFGLPFRS